MFWSNFYDNIFEHPERPEQRVINNDDLLDKWVEEKSKEMEDRARKNSRGYNKASMSAHDHDEVIIFDEEEWEEILDEEYDEYEDII